jgi:Cysteine-rich secretory protein family
MKRICFLLGLMIAVSSARAEDITAMISQYRREHGLPAVKTDAKLTAVAVRQAQAMASSGIMDHDVAGSFASRIAGANTASAAENIAAGTKTWADTLRIWKASPGHNTNLLRPDADIVGVAVAHNENTRYKTYWAMVIARKPTKRDAVIAATPSLPSPASGGGKGGGGVRVRRTQEESSVGTLFTSAVNRLKSLLP